MCVVRKGWGINLVRLLVCEEYNDPGGLATISHLVLNVSLSDDEGKVGRLRQAVGARGSRDVHLIFPTEGDGDRGQIEGNICFKEQDLQYMQIH